jgi:hypothetical protein
VAWLRQVAEYCVEHNAYETKRRNDRSGVSDSLVNSLKLNANRIMVLLEVVFLRLGIAKILLVVDIMRN